MALLVAALLFNLRTYNDYPTVWADEVLWSEPAINLVKTGHFTTSVWQFQRAGSFWAAQSPLYCFGIAAWMKVFGTDLLAARAFNYVLVTLAVLLTWLASWRCALLARPAFRVMLVPLLLCGYGISFAYRCSRPDIAGMVCVLSFGLAFFIPNPRRRWMALLFLAALAPWVGIQVGLYVGIVCALAKLFFRRVTWRDCFVVWGALLLGLASMLGFFWANGVLSDLLASVFQAANEKEYIAGVDSYGASLALRVYHTIATYKDDLSCAALLAGMAVIGLWFRGGWRQRALWFLVAIVLTIPLAFSLVAHFAFYYTYMIYVPLVIAFLMLCERAECRGSGRSWLPFLCGMVVAAACVVGLPLRIVLSRYFCELVPRAQYAPAVQSALSPQDVIFADYTAFFECKAVAHRVYSPMYSTNFANLSPRAQDFTEAEKAEVTVLVVPASTFAAMKDYWGGEWVPVTPPLGDSIRTDLFPKAPQISRRLQSYFSNPQCVRRPIQVFRRVSVVVGASEVPQ